MYPNVKAEFARKGLTLTMVSEALNMSLSTFSMKFREGRITLTEAKRIKKLLGTDMSLEELFKEADECA